jgi:hypothetical protein
MVKTSKEVMEFASKDVRSLQNSAKRGDGGCL